MNFSLGSVAPERETKPYYIFLVQDNKLLVKKLDIEYAVLTSDDLAHLEHTLINKFYIGSLDDYSCYTARFIERVEIPNNMEFVELRQLFGKIEEVMLQIAFRAIQILGWNETHQYCGVCGEKTEKKPDEHAKVCPQCGHTSYPRLSPAVIVAVTKNNKLLLATNKNPRTGMYSVLAGFVEAGETLEECAKRELREEAGIEIKNITYFGSESWPFPHSYMIAFTAEHESGEIRIAENEIADARWFSAGEILNMTNLPSSISISRKLIDWFIEKSDHV